MAALAGAIVVALRTQRGLYAKDRISLKLPVMGPIVLSAVLNRFSRTLAMVLKAGVPLGQTFDAVIAGTGNKVFQRGLATVKEQMTGGEGFAGPRWCASARRPERWTPTSSKPPISTKRSSIIGSAP
jgi:type IV pilus assembly protein PilC